MSALAPGAVALALLCACANDARPRGGGEVGPVAPILEPDRLVIHPLTRIGIDAAGDPVIVCHFDLRDDYGQPVRALGLARVELFRPGSEFADGSQIQDLVWRTDLTTPEANARHYDGLVTRTYTLSLGGLPEWLLAWHRGEGPAGAVSPTVRVTLFRGRETPEGTLSDVFRLSR